MKPVYDLIERKLPGASDKFLTKIIPTDDCDVYGLESHNGKVVLKGNNINSLCKALGHFIKHILCEDLSWNSIDAVYEYKEVDFEPFVCNIQQKYRSYMNFCTHSYSCAWWDKDRWEKEIDLMALYGINLPLAITGSEGIWYYTLLEFGFTDEEARGYLVGPAYLAWQHMGNIETFAGPLPESWIRSHIELGRWIINRETELGMTPIQQGFTGCVPIFLKDRYPDSKILLKKIWNNISATAQLDPTDELFLKIGNTYTKVMKDLFGLYGFYAADPFHEGYPPVEGSDYLEKVGNIIKDMMYENDPGYKWVMQSWSIRYDIVKVVDKNHILILDLTGSGHGRSKGFWGYEFITGTLHNFGARMNLHGDIGRLAANTYIDVKKQYSNVSGTGLFMEGIGQNPLYYDLAFDMLTSEQEINIDEFLAFYCRRRYKSDDIRLTEALNLLVKTVYSKGSDNVLKCASLICARPSLKAKGSGPCDEFDESYNNDNLLEVCRLFSDVDADTAGLLYDKCDVLRQYLSNYALNLYRKITESYRVGNYSAFDACTEKFKQLLLDIDELTYQVKSWRMQDWINSAVSMAGNEDEASLYEYNARAQVTIWGNERDCVLFDYAWKEWSGLISGYYLMRWSRFFDMLSDKAEKSEAYSDADLPEFENRITWRADEFRCNLSEREIDWIHSRSRLCSYREDIGIYDRLLEKYGNNCD